MFIQGNCHDSAGRPWGIAGAVRSRSHLEGRDRALQPSCGRVAAQEDDTPPRPAGDLVPPTAKAPPLEGLLARREGVEEAMPEDDVQGRVRVAHTWILPLPTDGGEAGQGMRPSRSRPSAIDPVWTALRWQGVVEAVACWLVRPCVRPVGAAHSAAGHNAIRVSGPDQKLALEVLGRIGFS